MASRPEIKWVKNDKRVDPPEYHDAWDSVIRKVVPPAHEVLLVWRLGDKWRVQHVRPYQPRPVADPQAIQVGITAVQLSDDPVLRRRVVEALREAKLAVANERDDP